MPQFNQHQSSFTRGEISPRLHGRTDLAQYQSALERCENFVPMIHGGAERVPGSRFIREGRYASIPIRLVPFQFSTEQAYMLEFGRLYIRFYTNRGLIVDSNGDPVEVTTPYTHQDISDLQWAQNGDIMYLFRKGFAPRKLSRFSNVTWTLTEVAPDDGPFEDQNADTTLTLTTDNELVGTGRTLTASADLFSESDVGRLVYIEEQDLADVGPWETAKTYTAATTTPGDYVRSFGNTYECTSGSGGGTAAGPVPPSHLEGAAWDGKETDSYEWTYLHSGFGIARITAFTNAQNVTADVLARFPASVQTGTSYKWRLGSWSETTGYPQTGAFADERLVSAGTSFRPNRFDGSRAANNFENYLPGEVDSDPYSFQIGSPIQDGIRWIFDATGGLLLGTAGGIFSATGETFEAPITPDTIRVRQANADGSSKARPVIVGPYIIYISRDRRQVLELAYDFTQSAYIASDLTLMADHLAYEVT